MSNSKANKLSELKQSAIVNLPEELLKNDIKSRKKNDSNPQQGEIMTKSSSGGSKKKIPPTKHDGRKLFVGGLPKTVKNDEFRKVFERFGPLLDSAVIYDSETRISRGFGFVTFQHRESAITVLGGEGRHSTITFQGKVCEIKPSEPKRIDDDEASHSTSITSYSTAMKQSYHENSLDCFPPQHSVCPGFHPYSVPQNSNLIPIQQPFPDQFYNDPRPRMVLPGSEMNMQQRLYHHQYNVMPYHPPNIPCFFPPIPVQPVIHQQRVDPDPNLLVQPAISHRQPAISHRQPAISHRPPAIPHRGQEYPDQNGYYNYHCSVPFVNNREGKSVNGHKEETINNLDVLNVKEESIARSNRI